MSLDPDIRCHDQQCRVKEGCHRWLLRDEGRARIHATTLRPAWQCWDLPCSNAWMTEEWDDEQVG